MRTKTMATNMSEPLTRSDYITGVASLDEQRMSLVQLLDLILAAAQGRGTTHLLAPMLRDLLDFFTQHCQYEEQLMSAVDYSEIQAHQKIHRSILESLRELVATTRGRKGDGEQVQSIQTMVMGHMQSVDDEFIQKIKVCLMD